MSSKFCVAKSCASQRLLMQPELRHCGRFQNMLDLARVFSLAKSLLSANKILLAVLAHAHQLGETTATE